MSVERGSQSSLIQPVLPPATALDEEGATSYDHFFSWRAKLPKGRLRLMSQAPRP